MILSDIAAKKAGLKDQRGHLAAACSLVRPLTSAQAVNHTRIFLAVGYMFCFKGIPLSGDTVDDINPALC